MSIKKQGLNPDLLPYLRSNLANAQTCVTLVTNTLDTVCVTSSAKTHEQCQALQVQLRAIGLIITSIDTSLGHHLASQFMDNEQDCINNRSK